MYSKLTGPEVESFCINTIKSFEMQFQTIDPLETNRARLKLYGLRQQLHALRWDAKDVVRQIAANPLEHESLYPLQVLEKTLAVLSEVLQGVEYDINKNDPKKGEYFFHRSMNL